MQVTAIAFGDGDVMYLAVKDRRILAAKTTTDPHFNKTTVFQEKTSDVNKMLLFTSERRKNGL